MEFRVVKTSSSPRLFFLTKTSSSIKAEWHIFLHLPCRFFTHFWKTHHTWMSERVDIYPMKVHIKLNCEYISVTIDIKLAFQEWGNNAFFNKLWIRNTIQVFTLERALQLLWWTISNVYCFFTFQTLKPKAWHLESRAFVSQLFSDNFRGLNPPPFTTHASMPTKHIWMVCRQERF